MSKSEAMKIINYAGGMQKAKNLLTLAKPDHEFYLVNNEMCALSFLKMAVLVIGKV